MITNISTLGGLLVYWGGLFLAYRFLTSVLTNGRIVTVFACAIFWLIAAAAPLPLWKVVGAIANHLYSNNPSLWEQSWDVRLVLHLYLGFWISAITGFLGASYASWRFIGSSKRIKQA